MEWPLECCVRTWLGGWAGFMHLTLTKNENPERITESGTRTREMQLLLVSLGCCFYVVACFTLEIKSLASDDGGGGKKMIGKSDPKSCIMQLAN